MAQDEPKPIRGLIEQSLRRQNDDQQSSSDLERHPLSTKSEWPLTELDQPLEGDGDPDCEFCGGLGWLSNNAVSVRHRDFGKLIVCQCLEAREKPQRLRAFSNIPAGLLYENMTFASFDRSRDSIGAYAATVAISEGQPMPFFLIFQGGPGLGKTHLAVAAVRHSIEQGESARFAYVPDILAELRSLMNNETVRPDAWLELYASVGLLALDDFGVENAGSGWVREQLDTLINRRHARGLRTIVTTNLRVNEIPRRIYDRLFDQRYSSAFEFSGPSYRSGEKL